ncbi:hypothetical protein C1D09_018820 [Mesorhizobium intechi]|uniref:hypothetical protein n=1 Tax=Mesorhizobium intechi TaxID=537601 RepID=UPI000CBB0F5B|nr:hypothetical protein [Mesorhizobium intechi]TSE07586.1 hypothetical protein C1D09_018820 [Mesorhizobium intechi]
MDIFKLLRRQSNTAADLKAALAAIDLDGAEAVAEGIEAERKRILLDGTDKELAAVEERLAAAYRHIERLGAAKEELERRIEAATAAETQQERTVQYASAKAQADAAAKLLTTRYPAIARDFIGLLKTLAEAQLAVDDANQRLPDGAAPLMDPETAVRALLGQPEKTLEEVKVSVWCFANSPDIRVLPPEKQDELNTRFPNSDRGSIHSGSAVGSTEVVKRRVIRRTYVPRTNNTWPARLAAIDLPGLKVGDPYVWQASTNPDPRLVLANLARLAAMRPAPAINQADVRVEYIEPSGQGADASLETAE